MSIEPPIAFHSAVVDVLDFDSGVADYATLLGQSPLRLESNASRGTRSAIFPLANTLLEIREIRGEGEPRSGHSAGSEETAGGTPETGLSGIRLTCERDASISSLRSHGLRVEEGRDEQATLPGGRSARHWRSHAIDRESSRGIPVELVTDDSMEWVADGSSGSSDPTAQVRALDHVVVFSAAPDATRAFYGDELGIRLALDKSFEGRGVRLLFFRVGGVTIEIGGRLGAEPRKDRADRFGGLAWQVVGVDAIQARLLAEGLDVSEIRDGNKPGTRVCTVRDRTHGVPTLLIEPV